MELSGKAPLILADPLWKKDNNYSKTHFDLVCPWKVQLNGFSKYVLIKLNIFTHVHIQRTQTNTHICMYVNISICLHVMFLWDLGITVTIAWFACLLLNIWLNFGRSTVRNLLVLLGSSYTQLLVIETYIPN